ncbi:MAG: chromophore lyase CpcT/CpeT [Leptolyngbyaceae bacterium]|nr:chromophore lyase CpcT/CpeT [Leptolyngbyaceae bacterium]
MSKFFHPNLIQRRRLYCSFFAYLSILSGVVVGMQMETAIATALSPTDEWLTEFDSRHSSQSLETAKQSASLEGRDTTVDLERHADAILSRLQGVMDTSEQAEESDRFVAVQMTTCEIGLNGDGLERFPTARFVYQEQALIERLEEPYRQRFLAIAPDPLTNSVQSITFRPPELEPWVGLCDRPLEERIVRHEDVGEMVCRVFLRPSPLGYIGKTPIGGCPASLQGAVTITNTIVLHEDGMDTWDRGFDATGNQVWGAATTPYQYRWTDLNR